MIEELVTDLGLSVRALAALARAGVLAPVRPDRTLRMAAALRGGATAATGIAIAAARQPDQPALIDERGTLTYRDIDLRATAVAAGLAQFTGVGEDRPLAIMCRNHRGFIDAMIGGSRLGADLLLLNTEFRAQQLEKVLERERPGAAVFDAEFAEAFDEAGFEGGRVIAWHDGEPGRATLDGFVESPRSRAPRSRRRGRVVVLTSGTTGTPKGAQRDPSLRALLGPFTALMTRVPLRAREPMLVAPPFFHGFGLAYLGLGLFLGSTIVTHRRFDAETALAAIERHRITTTVAVPVMYQRILEFDEQSLRHYDASSLEVAISAAAPLSPVLAERFMDAFGEVLYNLYGSTETGFGAIATPKDLREAPGTTGRAPEGTALRILDDDRNELPPGETGTIFMGGPLVFEGYSGGGGKETVNGMMSTGDLGHLDEEGRLFVEGRDDDMIVSGGENVYPQEVEDVLADHGAVADVAVVGVDDEEFGQRLKAFVVARGGEQASEEELKTYLKERLARYQVPREISFVDEIPRNQTGKVLRSEL